MKKTILILLSLMIVAVSAQELDENFLESLPDDIRKDLSEKNANQGSDSQENYRPYLYSSKLSQAEELLDLKDRLELDLLELERRLNAQDGLYVGEKLELYGLDFFNTFQTTFMPINEPNPDSGYVLDIGDILNIQLVGQINETEDFLINNDGSISLQDIGKIIIAGLSLNDASQFIKSKINAALIGTEAFISLSEIRDVNVMVSGNAKNPGIYTLTGNSNILHAISVAGGISEFGSVREINLLRDDKVIESLDVYDLLIKGKYNIKKRLRSGDVIFVEARKNIVTIDGAVHRPAKYEILDDQNLHNVIKYANGIKQTADLSNMSLERILDGTLKTIPVFTEAQFETIKAIDGDLIYVRDLPFRQAKISGAVLKPGSYPMAEGETINDLVEKAGGYTNNAYEFGAIYQNEDAKIINKKARDILYNAFLDNIIDAKEKDVSGMFEISSLVALAQEIRDSEPNGRVIIDLINDRSIDLYTVKEGDELHIPEANNIVYVYGEISTEGTVMYTPNKGIDHFIAKSGGYGKFADSKSIFILHPNGESQLYKRTRNIFESSPQSDIQVYPGSIIFVPRTINDAIPRRLSAQAYVSILGNLGIALASLSSINNN
ncbi:SLBB domain-containing protein [Gammaproteobacteria bacterium]|nr:SLBB domain-containing protein [Gammaproteobacteria bacterium]